ncbi:conserved hypothetical protein [Crenothrix polyspora]|uniref:Uncharacterized protein n=1 Tax=Crenothrix polyspora TaxID=360316 RepID=A0A1R4H016_9GAMM|nr:phage holin family protein [Crenothrix polyspora]SJM89542.1 conserved hypothetical protein [Crenothrix polyspora]
MDSNTKKAEVVGQAAAHDDPANAPSVLDDAQALWSELRGLGYDHLRLAALETQRAGESLVSMVMAAVNVAILLMAAWLGLMAAAVLWSVENNLVATSSAILLAVVFNLLLALIFCGVIRRKRHYLQFPSTLRSFQPMPSQQNTEKP